MILSTAWPALLCLSLLVAKVAADDAITHTRQVFDNAISNYFYLNGSTVDDETIFLKTESNVVYMTHDHGSTWTPILDKHEIVAAFPHYYANDYAFFITPALTIFYTKDRGKTFQSFDAPADISGNDETRAIDFNFQNPEYLIWNGEEGCEDRFSDSCRQVAYYSTDMGKKWKLLLDGATKCSWGQLEEHPDLALCMREKSGDWRFLDQELVASYDFFNKDETVAFDSIIDFAIEPGFVVVATEDTELNTLKAHVSVDGKNYADAKFPANFQVDHQSGYTILDSRTKAIFMHVTVNTKGAEYGSILKSNSNGTDYVESLAFVNRNQRGYVDFERVLGLEGVELANTNINPEESSKKAIRKLKTQISHNDGGDWGYLRPPSVDSDGNSYGCRGSLEKCSLNLHGYTERSDLRDTYSSPGAVGVMIGVGSVGESLEAMKDSNTFLTRDGGVTWEEIKKGPYMWEFGDRGGIIVIVPSGRNLADTLYYSLDEGRTFSEYKFSEQPLYIDDIATVPSDNARKFLLIGTIPTGGVTAVTIQVDFTGLTDRKCGENDFDMWSPVHPLHPESKCLFGHITEYPRKKPSSTCYIGRDPVVGKLQKNCECTRQDYECDFNYHKEGNGDTNGLTCSLVPGYSPPDHKAACKENPGLVEYWEPTGYRKIPISTCEGGEILDKVISHACPGRESEYENVHRGIHGAGLFFVIVLPIAMAGVVGYIFFDAYKKRYGQIRLGIEDDEQPVALKYAVMSVATAVAMIAVIPKMITSIVSVLRERMGGSRQRFTSRSSFSNYTPVVPDDDELLGADDVDDDLMVGDDEAYDEDAEER